MTGSLQHLSTKSEIREQACEWVSRLDRSLNEKERQALINWMNASASHKTALFEMAALWDNLAMLESLVDQQAHSNKPQRSASQSMLTKAAAVFFIGLVLSFLTTRFSTTDEMVQYKTGVGEQKTWVLSDNTSIKLNTSTTMDVLISEDVRRVVLHKGEAHFDIAKDPSRPFEVHAGNARFTAVGTAFNVSHWHDEPTSMIVTEGLVSLTQKVDKSSNDDAVEVVYPSLFGERDKAELNNENKVVKAALSPSDMNQALAWHDGMLLFSGETLSTALEQINRYSDVEFRIADPVIGDKRIAGYFKAGDIDGLLSVLEKNFNIQHRKLTDSHILLSMDNTI